MGKGRAFAVAAEQIIEQKLLDKRANQSIKQICIVHSFAGGRKWDDFTCIADSGKRVCPTALIWSFVCCQKRCTVKQKMIDNAKAAYTLQVTYYRHITTLYITLQRAYPLATGRSFQRVSN